MGDGGTIPNLGQSQLNFLSEDQEVQLGEQNAPEVLKELGGELNSPTIQQHVESIGMKMAKLSERPDLPWHFYVVDTEVINAFALPGGKIFITRGLISKMDNDAQLAGVLGHEVGHVTAEHAGQQMAHDTIVGIGAAGVAARCPPPSPCSPRWRDDAAAQRLLVGAVPARWAS